MKKKQQQMLSEYEIDNIWMSYRYCIPRHTIASHCHAGDIANNLNNGENWRLLLYETTRIKD